MGDVRQRTKIGKFLEGMEDWGPLGQIALVSIFLVSIVLVPAAIGHALLWWWTTIIEIIGAL